MVCETRDSQEFGFPDEIDLGHRHKHSNLLYEFPWLSNVDSGNDELNEGMNIRGNT